MDIARLFISAFRNFKSILINRPFFSVSFIFLVVGTILFAKQISDIKSVSATVMQPMAATTAAKSQGWEKINIIIRPGENLSEVFEKLNLSQEQLQDIIAQKIAYNELTLLFPKEKMEIFLGPNRVIEQINFPINLKQMLQVTRAGENYISKIIPRQTETKFQIVSGIIKYSFSTDALRSRLHPKQIKEFSHIFADEINFRREVKPGDKFSVVYETYFANNELIGSGDIIAAEYINRQSKAYRAIRDKDSLGRYNYYSPDGTNLRKAFMRYPLIFNRISSRFSLLRKHPALNQVVRPHKGVDFAAPIGRPVEAAGDGEIIFAGTKTGFGNTIVIRHSPRYKTLYAHLDHFAKDIHAGMRVKEGQVIAYVGETGIATGPHLHYEFSVDGTQRNPLTVAFPQASGVPTANSTEFAAKVKELTPLLTPVQNAK